VARKRRIERRLDEPPEFDAADFLRKEISDAKLTFVTFIIAILFTAGSIGLYHAGLAAVGILLGFAGVIALPFFYQFFKVDLDALFPPKEGKLDEEEQKQEKRGRTMRMVGQRFTFFFTWLAIFVIALNPPFADVSGPAVVGLHATGSGGPWNLSAGDPPVIRISAEGSFLLHAKLVDPAGIKDDSVMFYDKASPDKPVQMKPASASGGVEEFTVPVTLSKGETRTFWIVSQDSQGHASRSIEFAIKSTA
jgi:hypothetical protein